MGPAFYVMAILGCGDGGVMCRDARLLEARYVSADACAVAMAAMLTANSDLPFPTLVAECRAERQPMVANGVRARHG